jgi:hypothetical protein
MEERPPIWTAANIWTKKSQTAYKGGTPALGLGEVGIIPHLKNWPYYKTVTTASGLD